VTTFASPLPRATASIRSARELVELHSVGLSAAQHDDAGLMVSELVTNALVHGRGAITIRIASQPAHLTIEVADEGHGTVSIVPAPGAAGGWGLRIVDELADDWGTRKGSTRVWFRLLVVAAD
jgi:two-component sensor histidine kinase